jgi:hypothetical protein
MLNPAVEGRRIRNTKIFRLIQPIVKPSYVLSRLFSIHIPSQCSCSKGQQRKAYVLFFMSPAGTKHALECIIHLAAILFFPV